MIVPARVLFWAAMIGLAWLIANAFIAPLRLAS